MDMNMESSKADRAVEANRDHPSLMDSNECSSEIDVVVQNTNEEDNQVQPPGN
jgi:hypothetical protein